MSFSQAVRHVFVNYVNFKGRAGRSEYWWFYLFSIISYLALCAIAIPLGWMPEGRELSYRCRCPELPERTTCGSAMGLGHTSCLVLP